MLIKNEEQLLAWIASHIPSSCDAEPVKLSQYVLTLLKKPDANEENACKKICEELLEVFFKEGTSDFVSELMQVLRSDAYLTAPTKQEEVVVGRNNTHPKILPPPDVDSPPPMYDRKRTAHYSSVSNSEDDGSDEEGGKKRRLSSQVGKVVRRRQLPATAAAARSGQIQVVIQRRPEGLKSGGGGGGGGIRRRVNWIIRDEQSEQQVGEANTLLSRRFARPIRRNAQQQVMVDQGYNPDQPALTQSTPLMMQQPPPTILPTATAKRPRTQSLLVRGLQPDCNNIARLHEHFSRFGVIKNIQTSFEGLANTALISFENSDGATLAFSSKEPLFNNRFVRLFFHTPAPTPPVPLQSGLALEAIPSKPVVVNKPANSNQLATLLCIKTRLYLKLTEQMRLTLLQLQHSSSNSSDPVATKSTLTKKVVELEKSMTELRGELDELKGKLGNGNGH